MLETSGLENKSVLPLARSSPDCGLRVDPEAGDSAARLSLLKETDSGASKTLLMELTQSGTSVARAAAARASQSRCGSENASRGSSFSGLTTFQARNGSSWSSRETKGAASEGRLALSQSIAMIRFASILSGSWSSALSAASAASTGRSLSHSTWVNNNCRSTRSGICVSALFSSDTACSYSRPLT